MILPAVTLADPWASLIIARIKTLETRKGAILSGFSGPLVIHRNLAPAVPFDLSAWPEADAWWREHKHEQRPGELLGMVNVQGTARLTMGGPRDLQMFAAPACRPVWLDLPLADLRRRACFHDIEGRYLSDLSGVTPFAESWIEEGKQYRFKVEVPDEWLPAWARIAPLGDATASLGDLP